VGEREVRSRGKERREMVTAVKKTAVRREWDLVRVAGGIKEE